MPLELDLQDVSTATRATIGEIVFDDLRRAIMELRLAPGAKISEVEIAKRLGVSRQPVREAFSRLARSGYLRIQPQRATEVVKISPREVMNATFIRVALETATVRKAAETREEDALESLREIVERQAHAQSADDRVSFHREDDAFHKGLAEAGDCAFAWTLIDEHKAQMDRVRFLSLAFGQPTALGDHQAILQAVEARDPDAAEAAMRTHLARTTPILTRLRAEFGQHFIESQP